MTRDPSFHSSHVRLRRVFARALLLSAGGALAACNELDAPPSDGATDAAASSGDAGSPPRDGGGGGGSTDGGTGTDGGVGSDGGEQDAGPPPIDTRGFALLPCNAAEGVTLSPTPDYLAVHEIGVQVLAPFPTGSTGSPCGGASDRTTCMGALEATGDSYVAASWQDHAKPPAPISPAFVTTTRGDAVSLAYDRATLLALLGSVDAAAEAALVATMAGYDVSCSDPELGGARADGDAFLLIANKMTKDCAPIELYRYLLRVAADGSLSEERSELYSTSQACVGRRPAGLVNTQNASSPCALGVFFAEIAHLEAAAVHAFSVLVRELEALGAPAALVRQARAAIADEIRHAASMGELAQRFGGELRRVRVEGRPLRDLYALALDNAVEGCVRETWGALFGAYQAQHAQDPAVRRAMATIADDETRHAALSWQIHHWALGQLTGAQRAAIADAQHDAVSALACEAGHDHAEVHALAGTPSRAACARLLAVLRHELWTPALAA